MHEDGALCCLLTLPEELLVSIFSRCSVKDNLRLEVVRFLAARFPVLSLMIISDL